jgi:hypothetical protein
MPDPYFYIRASRAHPPGLAGGDPDRRLVYGAALSQFDELMETAAKASARSRPLPLFYALSQAGRAIAAALGDDTWRLRGHGLSAPALGRNDPCEVEIVPSEPREGETIDSFHGVAMMTGSECPAAPVSIGELWSSVPGVCDLLPDEERWRRPLAVAADESEMRSPLFDFSHCRAVLRGVRGEAAESVETELARYRGTVEGKVMTYSRSSAELAWANQSADVPGWRATLERVAPIDALTERRWLRPRIGDADLNTLMTWWALLFGLSMLARYEPGYWVNALDFDRSGRAAQLSELMDVALDAIPQLVLEAISVE